MSDNFVRECKSRILLSTNLHKHQLFF